MDVRELAVSRVFDCDGNDYGLIQQLRDSPGWHMVHANHKMTKRLWNWHNAASETAPVEIKDVLRIGKMDKVGPRLVALRAQ